MIIDAHAHLSPTSYGSFERYLELLAQSDIDGGVVCAGGMLDVRNMNDFVLGVRKPSTTPRNDYVERATRQGPRLHGVACVNPCDRGAAGELSRYLSEGFRGLFVSPLVHPFSFTDDSMVELATLCAERELPVISHNGWRPGANTEDYVRLAKKVPRARFILEHMGAHPVDVEARTAATELSNFYLETSLASFLHIVETVKAAGPSKVIFGSEYPLSHPGVELAKLRFLPITERERDLILGENARALFRLGAGAEGALARPEAASPDLADGPRS
ncbi:MAG TPA: amidohydrolase family protein [Polyangiaceae bacterium]|nr:amidohydrolase family protein [Polyangiaceae bacterium]